MDREDLDDTYDLLSPVRKSYEYGDSFASSDEDSRTRGRSRSPTDPLQPLFVSKSSSLPPPKYASTTRYQSKPEKNYKNVAAALQQPRILPTTKTSTSSMKTHDTTKELMKMPQEDDITDLSVWEDWLIKKLQDEREKIKVQKQAEKEAKQEGERLKKEKEDHKKKAEMKHQQWCEEKLLKLKLQKTIDKREKLLKEELKAQKKEVVNKKAKAAYQRWFEKQEEKEKGQKEKDRQKKEKEDAEQDEKRKKNEESFQQWLQKVNEKEATSPRPKSVGPKEYPSPSYKNPTHWVGPMEDQRTRDSVRQQHKFMIAEKHATITRNQKRSQSTTQLRKGLVKTGPGKGKGVLICRPATSAPLFCSVPNNNNKRIRDVKAKGRS